MKLTDTIRPRSSRLLIGLILAAAGLFTFLRAHFREPFCDEILYGYVLQTDTPFGYWKEHGFSKPITTIGEVIASQANHYIYANGRSLVHAVEQIFTGIVGVDVYNAAGAAMMVLLISWCMAVAIPARQRRRPLLWMLATIGVMYLMPYIHRLWYSINYSCNYLIPSVLMMAEILLLRQIDSGRHISRCALCGIGLVSFCFGWSHESFALPMAGGVLFHYMRRPALFRRRGWILALPLWAGSLIILLSPGNWARVSEESPMLFVKVACSLDWLMRIPETWVFLAVLTAAVVSRRLTLREFLSRNAFLLTVCALDIGFLCYILAWHYAYTPAALIMLCLTLRILGDVFPALWSGRTANGAAMVLAVLFVIHQTLITADCRTMARYQRTLVSEFKAGDGVMLNDPPEPGWLTRPFVTVWPLYNWQEMNDFLPSGAYSGYTKHWNLLEPAEYDVARHGTASHPRLSAESPFVATERWYWAEADSVAPGTEFEVEYFPVDFHHNGPLPLRVKFALSPGGYPSVERVTPDSVTIGARRFLVIRKPEIRKIRSIRPVKE